MEIKLLELWEPPQKDSQPIGCLSTSFTFDSNFYEEECLTRFINMESNSDEDGPVYLIEKEEKLSSLACAVSLVDVNHAKGLRSLRWDLIPFRSKKGILHAKITLLYWTGTIRLIIGSANLTPSGYRMNQEVISALDFNKDSASPLYILHETLDYLVFLMQENKFAKENPAAERWMNFIKMIKQSIRGWKNEEKAAKNAISMYPIFTNQGQDVFEQVKEVWSKKTNQPPNCAQITSPFFNEYETADSPYRSVWEVISKRGFAQVIYNVISEPHPSDKGKVIFKASPVIQYKPASRSETHLDYRLLSEKEIDGKGKSVVRPIHRKTLLLDNEDWYLNMIGSSNFTSAGYGISPKSNYEANLVYLTRKGIEKKLFDQVVKISELGEEFDEKLEIVWENPISEESKQIAGDLLHDSFLVALLKVDKGEYTIELSFETDIIPKGFSIWDEEGITTIYTYDDWLLDNSPDKVALQWNEQKPPSGLFVNWIDHSEKAWWPVIVVDSHVLPPPEELRNLPFEVLLNIISSSKPTYRLLGKYLSRKAREKDENKISEQLDPHRKVDNSNFLLQRTRSISYALTAIKKNIEKPIATIENLSWRLYGPIGVKIFYKGLLESARSQDEKVFLLGELMLELSKAKLNYDTDVVRKKDLYKMFNDLIEEIYTEIDSLGNTGNLQIIDYVTKVQEEVKYAFSV
ncbi:MAG: hypothetical protein KKA84_13630 [Bacteroidetes bacterium]|nr:hypothetical protein [Bacteroidota bacterium]